MRQLLRLAAVGRPVTGRLVLAVVAGVGAAGAAIGLTATSAWLISRAAERPPVLYLMVAITAVRAFGVGRGALRYGERLVAHDAAFRILAELRGRAYERLERLAPTGLTAFRSGDLLARLVADVDGLADLWLRVLLPYATAALVGLGTVILVASLVPAAGIVLAASLLFVAVAAPLAVGLATRRAERRLSPARGAFTAAALELMSGAPELLALGATQERLDELARLDRDLAHAEARASTGGGLGTLVAGLAGGATTWFVLLAGVTALRAGSLEGVALAVVVLTPLAVHEIVAGLVPAAGHLPGLAASATRLDAVLQRPDPVRDPATPRPLPDGPYGLRLRRLRTRYGAGGPELLGGLDLDLPAGGRALLTGPSGSGKSTLAALLMRFLDPSAGSIELVGSRADVDLGDLAADDARSVIGLCAQDAHVFDTTVLENLRLARPDATPEQIRSALRGAQLQDWAESLPSGLDTLVGEHGARLSGGQRQRLALARVLLAERPVLVLDEPTEHLDEPTAQAFVADLLEAAQGRTLLVLTHRPELFEAAGTWPVRVDLVPATAEPADDPLSGSSAALAGPAAPWPSAPWPGPPSPSAPSRGA